MVQYETEAEKQTRKLREKFAKQDADDLDEVVRTLLAKRPGRKFLWWLLELGQLGRNPFAGNALTTSFNCGELNVGQRVLDKILNVDAAGYAQLMKEQVDERYSRSQSVADALSGADSDAEADS